MSEVISFLGQCRNTLGESPLWDHITQRLWWIDASGVAATTGKIYSADANGAHLVDWTFPRAVGSIGLARDGLIAAMADGFYMVDEQGGDHQLVRCPTRNGALRFNDGKMDRSGNFIAGQLEIQSRAQPEAKLWRLAQGGFATVLCPGMRLANAICFSPKGDVLYFADSPEGCIRAHAYDPARATLGPRLATIDCLKFGSIPDGATVDNDGNLWVALVQKQAIACFSPRGALMHQVQLPAPYPSCPAFGGHNLQTLYVTTIANSGRSLRTDHPDAGRILVIDGLGATGVAEGRWSSNGL